MNRIVIPTNGLETYHEALLPDGHRVVTAWPNTIKGSNKDGWPNMHTANHNVFRLNAKNEVVWQVQRDDRGHMNWDYLNKEAKEEDPNCEGYFDSFTGMYHRFFEWRTSIYKQRPFPAREITEPIYFDTYAPGRLVRLFTRWWAYALDPETGIATCTGEPLK